AHLFVCDGDFDKADVKYRFAFADGVRFDLDEKAAAPSGSGDAATPTRKGPRGRPAAQPEPAPTPAPKGPAVAPLPAAERRSSPPFNAGPFRALMPLLDAAEAAVTETQADRMPRLKTGGDVLIRGATVLTLTGKVLERTDILVRGGKIRALGPNLTADNGVTVIEADGLFVMPGIIDTHSHFAISGGV